MVEDSENVVCVLFIQYAGRKRHRKNVKDCYSMDSCACGFETRSRVGGQPVSHFLTPPAQQASRCSFVKLGPSRVALQRSMKKRNPFLYFAHVFPMPHNFVNNLQKVNKKVKNHLTF